MINNYFYNLLRYNYSKQIYISNKYAAFNIYLISNQTNNDLQKILKKQLIFFNYLKKYTKNYLNIFCDHDLRYIIKNSSNNNFFNFIKYNQIYIKKSKYNILYIKLNPIVKKITINNYKKLIIPEKTLIRYFYKQIGIPIDYIDIRNSLKKINSWYNLRGFKWIKIEYFYNNKNNELYIKIIEYKLNKIIFKNINEFNLISYLNILNVNKCITKEFLLINNRILNINDLNLYITKIKKKYLINKLTYKVKYHDSGLILIIKYKTQDKNKLLLEHYNHILIKDLKINVKLFLLYIKNNQFKLITKINTYLKTLFLISIIKINKKYQIYKFILNNYYHYKLYYFSNTLNISAKFFFYFQYIYNILNNYLLYNCQYLKLIVINPYLYLITLITIKIELQFQYFKNIENKQNFIIEYKYDHQKNFLIYNYIKYKKNLNIKKIIKLYRKFLINYKTKIKYHYYYILFNKNLIIKNQLTISYNKYIYIKFNKFNLLNLINQYIYLIKVTYYNLFEIPKLFYLNHNFTIYFKINKLIGTLSKYIINSELFLKNSKNILLNLEYKLSIIRYHYIYIYINYITNIKSIIYYIPKLYINDKYYNIEFAIGIQLKIPIQYLENIRLELQIKNNKKFFIYFYKNSLFYK